MYINILTVYSLYTTGFGKVVSFWDGFDMVRFFGAQDLDTIEILQWWICSAGSFTLCPYKCPARNCDRLVAVVFPRVSC